MHTAFYSLVRQHFLLTLAMELLVQLLQLSGLKYSHQIQGSGCGLPMIALQESHCLNCSSFNKSSISKLSTLVCLRSLVNNIRCRWHCCPYISRICWNRLQRTLQGLLIWILWCHVRQLILWNHDCCCIGLLWLSKWIIAASFRTLEYGHSILIRVWDTICKH